MKKLPILIFIVLCFTAMATSYGSYRKAQRNIESDLQQALSPRPSTRRAWKQCAKTLYAPTEASPAPRAR